jgi:hypothetical protein
MAVVALLASTSLFAGPIEGWQGLEAAVRDGKISQNEARLKLETLIPELSSYVLSNYAVTCSSWAFPVAGYGIHALQKSDFQPGIVYGPYGKKGYDFFDGNKHGGHPAYDIFIRDKKRACIDDRTGKPVNAVAMEDCVALSVSTGWKHGDKLRGGNYAWLYNPKDNKFFYYAHLNNIVVTPGTLVKQGEAVGTIGRTGWLADMKTSPTHVHLMVLEYKYGNFVPFNYYRRLSTKKGI